MSFRSAFFWYLVVQATFVSGAVFPLTVLSQIVEVPHARPLTLAVGIGAAVTVAAWSYPAGKPYYQAACAAGAVAVFALYLAVAR